MKTLLIAIAMIVSTSVLAAEFLKVECYIAEGTTVTKTFDGYVYGSVKNSANRVLVEGKTIATSYVYRHGTPSTCRASSEVDSDSYYGMRNVQNVFLMTYDHSSVELSCAAGSVVKKYGDLANFTKGMENMLSRGLPIGALPHCLDVSGL